MKKRIGFVGIIVENRNNAVPDVQKILSKYASLILGRMGLPGLKENLSVITLIVEADSDEIGALTGQLGRINGVTVKSGLTK